MNLIESHKLIKAKMILKIFIFSLLFFFQLIPRTLSQSFRDKNLSLNTTSTWYEFKQNNPELKKENWAWISFITFKSKQAINLKEINLKWSGKFLKTSKISASLYQKKETTNNILIPIQKNLVCDGKWDKKNQQIIFKLNEKLVAVNKYYLVLSFPEKIKFYLKNGNFVLPDNDSLKLERIN